MATNLCAASGVTKFKHSWTETTVYFVFSESPPFFTDADFSILHFFLCLLRLFFFCSHLILCWRVDQVTHSISNTALSWNVKFLPHTAVPYFAKSMVNYFIKKCNAFMLIGGLLPYLQNPSVGNPFLVFGLLSLNVAFCSHHPWNLVILSVETVSSRWRSPLLGKAHTKDRAANNYYLPMDVQCIAFWNCILVTSVHAVAAVM